MAEAIGFILAVAGLYSSCVDAFDQIRAARSFGRDYEILSTRFDVRKARFLQWGDGVGLLHEVKDGRHPHLDDPYIRPAVEQVLHCIRMLLTDTEGFKSKYGLQETPEEGILTQDTSTDALISGRRRDLFRVSYDKFQARIRKKQKGSSLIAKTQWAITGRNDFQNLVSDLDGMIEDLYKLVPVQPAFRRMMVHEDITTLPEDLATLKLVDEACAVEDRMEDRDSWQEAVSLRVEATTQGTEDHCQINNWLAEVSSHSDNELPTQTPCDDPEGNRRSVCPSFALLEDTRQLGTIDTNLPDIRIQNRRFPYPLSPPSLNSRLRDIIKGQWSTYTSPLIDSTSSMFATLPPDPQRLICFGCDLRFKCKDTLFWHQQERCERDFVSTCSLCPLPQPKFYLITTLFRHHISSHGGECSNGCSRYDDLVSLPCGEQLIRTFVRLSPKKAWGCPYCVCCFNSFKYWNQHCADHFKTDDDRPKWSSGTMICSLLYQKSLISLPPGQLPPYVDPLEKLNRKDHSGLKEVLEYCKFPGTLRRDGEYHSMTEAVAVVFFVYEIARTGSIFANQDLPV